jgi:hypothetical protein
MKSAGTLAVITVSVATLARGLFGAPLAAASPTVSDIKITSSVDKASATLSRKAGGSQQEFLIIVLKEAFVSRDASTGMATGKRQHKPVVFITMTGPDAPVCSLLYPVVALARGGAGAIAALQTRGYNCTVTDAGSQDCQTVTSAQMCTDLANQLAENIDAALALGDAAERSAFLAGVQALGYAPWENTTTPTTSSTTSTTPCPTGQTDCRGTCVDLMTDSNNCGGCGNICPSTTPSCVGGVCTIL